MTNLSKDKIPCTVATIKVSPVIHQHYWMCKITLEYDGFDWWLRITDTFAVDRWQDDDASCRNKAPESFAEITAKQLAEFINNIAPCGPGYGGYRNVKPEEVTPLIDAAHRFSKQTTFSLDVKPYQESGSIGV